ncbi:flavin reductase family protein [Amycolatopsis pithecellobii]|uniref:Flavin reductase n=1 Tax=Amycolatopsis pithecellobii TaxID=664692 RepID=A0A6N7YZL5_9PSEU|nr:flavin reductase family protein [Amycolatopsis pithecellobii]MTD52534.1 flavin reductase [Amycolatopsis pithecellobii]
MTISRTEDLQSVFRNTMAGVCTPVSVVTTTWQNMPFGTTVSAFASLSMDPPMVLVSLDHRSELLTRIRESAVFGLNFLASHQSDVAANFAKKGGSGKFADVEWKLDGGVPRIPGAGGFVACEVAELIEAGDHVVVLGQVRRADTSGRPPLTYHDRVFGTHTRLSDKGA